MCTGAAKCYISSTHLGSTDITLRHQSQDSDQALTSALVPTSNSAFSFILGWSLRECSISSALSVYEHYSCKGCSQLPYCLWHQCSQDWRDVLLFSLVLANSYKNRNFLGSLLFWDVLLAQMLLLVLRNKCWFRSLLGAMERARKAELGRSSLHTSNEATQILSMVTLCRSRDKETAEVT